MRESGSKAFLIQLGLSGALDSAQCQTLEETPPKDVESKDNKLGDQAIFVTPRIKGHMKRTPPPDEEIIAYLIKNKTRDSGFIYLTKLANEFWKEEAFSVLRRKGANQDQTLECYSLGLTALYMNLLGQKFGGKSALKTYFNGICINIWLKKLNKKVTESAVIFPGDDQLTEFKAHDNNSDLQEIVDMLLNKIGEPCRTIERLKIEGYKLEEIANEVSMTLRQVKERSADCRLKLIELLKLNGYGR